MSSIVRPAEWPRWQPEILETKGPEVAVVDSVVTGRARLLGFDVHGHSTTVDVDEDMLHESVIVGVRMSVRYVVSARAGETTIRHELTLHPVGGMAGRALGVLLRPRLRRMQRKALANLAAQAEAGSS